ncbi:MAG: hypothetical protein HBSAPP03_10700 [Phycisphaerae bacterium]|nr:MAG: hypothetical protein HBSAPP03_10700 [Phycisphaerae bacterium]
MGYTLLFVLAAIVGMLAWGVDIRYQGQRLVSHLFGPDVMYDVTIYGIVAQGLMAYVPTLFPWAGIPLLVALHLAPGRRRLILGGLIVAWMFLAAGAWLRLAHVYKNAGLVPAGWPMIDAGLMAGITIDLGTLIVLWVLTRDTWIAVAGVVALAIAWPIASIPSPMNIWCFVGVGTLHAITTPAIIRWGLHARRAAMRPPYVCPSCGYDRRGVCDRPCPECGFIESESASR